ncbi:hypothetical protein [Aquipuribacter hungaricus]|uniref:Uncharacterized protein n=2 Tax=Aquipuribacter hungaricus TaxID=545624 RepID=A0ABV7WGT0_9MICO
MVATGVLLPAASAVPAPARDGAAARATVDRPPLRPTGAVLSDPAAPCATGDARPAVRSGTPTVYAVHRDRDGGRVQAVVSVTSLRSPSTGEVVWSTVTAPQVSGAGHAVQVGGLEHGGVYRVRTHTVDAGQRRGPSVSCELEVDLVAPAPPTVTAVAVGTQPVYLPGVPSGGVGQPGSFVLGAGGSDDVVGYRYSLGGGVPVTAVTGDSPTVTVTPTSEGSTRLEVRSVDRAGWLSPVTGYDVVVPSGSPRQVTWRFDETTGTRAASATPDGGDPLPMTLSPSLETRVGGLLAMLGSTTDLALDLDGADDVARTSAPAVTTTGSYSVSASLRSAVTGGAATALSQDGTATAGFRLGYQPCDDGTGSCWSFGVPVADAVTAAPTTVLSGIEAEAGAWAVVTGVHDATAGTLSLWVCHPVPGDFGEQGWELDRAGTVAAPAPWAATGPLRLGGAGGPDPAAWTGAVGEVRVAAGVPSDSTLLRRCPPLG